MRLPEQRLWDAMRAALRCTVCMHRVENVVEVGHPDLLLGRGAWVRPCELKAVERAPKREATTRLLGGRGLSVAQRNWHHDWCARWRCHSLILIGLGAGVRREVILVHGKYCDEINEATTAQLRRLALVWGGWTEIKLHIEREVDI